MDYLVLLAIVAPMTTTAPGAAALRDARQLHEPGTRTHD
jgi:hypothetical protein